MSIVNTIFVLVEFAVHWWETMSIVNTIFALVEFAVHWWETMSIVNTIFVFTELVAVALSVVLSLKSLVKLAWQVHQLFLRSLCLNGGDEHAPSGRVYWKTPCRKAHISSYIPPYF